MRSKTRAWMSRQRGFSLVELLVVALIIMLVAAFSLPAIARYARVYRIQGAAQAVAQELGNARMLAIKKNTNNGVVFVTLPPSTPPGNPTNLPGFRWVNQDTVFQSQNVTYKTGRPLEISAALAIAGQSGTLRLLPSGIQFGAPNSLANNNKGVRFNRMGMMCNPGPADNACPALDAGGDLMYVNAATGQARVTLRQPQTGLAVEITMMPGGRIVTKRSWVK